MIERLVYRSLSAGADHRAEMDAILRVSVWNNARHKITGALGRFEANYLQVLEAPTAALDALLANLMQDQRHLELTILSREFVPFRLFPGWSMARADLVGEDGITHSSLRDAAVLTSVLSDLYTRGETAVA